MGETTGSEIDVAGTSRTPIRDELIHPPQKPIHVFFLVVATFGLYLCVYLYQQARDLQRLDQQPIRPWLWVFAPLIPLSLPFALPTLTNRYAALASAKAIPCPDRGLVYGLCLLLLGIADRAYTLLANGYHNLFSLCSIVLVGIVISRLVSDLAPVKSSYDANRMTSAPNKLSAGMWATLIVGFAVTGTAYTLLLKVEMTPLFRPAIAQGERWHHPEMPFSLYTEDSWNIAAPGTFLIKSADAEFNSGTLTSVSIFDQTHGDSLNALIDSRRQKFLEDDNAASCQERRWLQEETLVRVAELTCESNEFGEILIVVDTHLEDGEKHFELYALSSTSKPGKAQTLENIRRFVSGFQIEPGAQL